MRVVVCIDPMEPTEILFAAPLRLWRWLWGLWSPAVLVPSFVSNVASVLVLTGGCGHIVDLVV
jgi:hypothetical protein